MMLIDNWHDAKTDRPQKNDAYLCVVDVSGNPFISIVSYALNLYEVSQYEFEESDGEGWYDYDDGFGYFKHEWVTHWTNLPSLPDGLNNK